VLVDVGTNGDVGVPGAENWDREDGEMGEATREETPERPFRKRRKGWLGWFVVGTRFSRSVADTVRHRSGSEVVRRRNASWKN
jgi:hypothetical protein